MKIRLLDIYRSFSAICVVLYHYTCIPDNIFSIPINFQVQFKYASNIGVFFLFMLTGFLGVLGIEKRRVLDYCVKRFSRLYPAYFTGIILTSIVLTLFLPSIKPSIPQILVNFTMLQKLFGYSGVDGVYWTLSIQLLFYALIAIVIWRKADKYLNRIIVLWSTISMFVTLIDWANVEIQGLAVIKLFVVSDYAPTLISGVLLGLVFGNKLKITDLSFVFCTLIGVLNIYFAWNFKNVIIYVIIYVAMFWVSQHKDIPTFHGEKVISSFAEISYPLYLLHCKIGYAIMRPFVENGYIRQWIIIIPFIVTLGISIIVHYYIEIPCQKKIISFFKKRAC